MALTADSGSHTRGERARSGDFVGELSLLRRYARSVSGSQATGDALVRATLEAVLADPTLLDGVGGLRVALYRAFTKIWTSADVAGERTREGLASAPSSQLERIPSYPRQALLLSQLEGFTLAQTAEILSISEEEARRLVTAAIAEIAKEGAADVLIIEDEPMIAGHLENIVVDCGHRVVGNATTAALGREMFDRFRPQLVLSDVQLADGSSGVDAVDAILSVSDVPVIFITGFAEKLLTGDRPEPVFLISKPFREETVRAAISQALFFGSKVERI